MDPRRGAARQEPPANPRPSLGAALVLVAALVTSAAAAVPHRPHGVKIFDSIYGVDLVDHDEGWVVGAFGTIYHTRDGGRTWEAQHSGTKRNLFSVAFADRRHGWIVGAQATVLHTADGGKTWKVQKTPVPPEKHLFKVVAIDAQHAWAVGDWGAIAMTADGGRHWEDRSLSRDVILYCVSFPDARHGWIAGEFGTVLATSDGGKTWAKQATGTDKTLFGLFFADARRGWAVGIDGLVLHTTDGGATWELQRGSRRLESIEQLGFLEALKNPGLYEVEVRGRYGVIVGDVGTVLTSRDGGRTWEKHELPPAKRLTWLRSVALSRDGAYGLVVGAHGFAARVESGRLELRAEGGGNVPEVAR